MIAKISICSVSLSILILKTTSNLIHPDYSVKMFNTENVILSLGDFDDLEVIKNEGDASELDEKLLDFQKFVKVKEKKIKPRKKHKQSKGIWWPPIQPVAYPDSPFEIATDEKHLSILERRQRRRKKRRQRGKNGMKLKESLNKVGKPPLVLVPDRATGRKDLKLDLLEKKYEDYLKQSQKEGTIFKYTDEGKPEETLADIFEKIVDTRPPKNCSEVLAIGVQAVECIIQDYGEGKIGKIQLGFNLCRILAIWFFIYLAIALPLWCYKGWCCCCWRCKFCYPNRTVQEIQRYLAENPPGTYTNPKGEEMHYTPTQKEIELYERLRRSIAEYY